jgi:hypothetical protein
MDILFHNFLITFKFLGKIFLTIGMIIFLYFLRNKGIYIYFFIFLLLVSLIKIILNYKNLDYLEEVFEN